MLYRSGIVFILLVVGGLALPAFEDDVSQFFFHTDISSPIVGGREAPVGMDPHMAAMTTGLSIPSFFCCASIITHRHFLTAAHCVDAVFSEDSLSSSLRLTVGTNRWDVGGQSYAISRNITHPHFLWDLIKNDISILISASNIVMSTLVQPVALSFDYVGGGVPVRAAGWGAIRRRGPLSPTLLELTMETISGEQCIAAVEQAVIDLNVTARPVEPHIELCTLHSPGHGMCNGDSGSALRRLDNGMQVGLVSWGYPCARGAPDVFTRITGFQDWIQASLER